MTSLPYSIFDMSITTIVGDFLLHSSHPDNIVQRHLPHLNLSKMVSDWRNSKWEIDNYTYRDTISLLLLFSFLLIML